MENSCLLHLLNIIEFYFLFLSLCCILCSCGQIQVLNRTPGIASTINLKDTNLDKPLAGDTGKIAILPIDTLNHWVFNNANTFQLTDHDLKMIDKLLNDCINANNNNKDTTKQFFEYINLKNYKTQYISFVTLKGEKKVYVNCFCLTDNADEFKEWKKSPVEVEDGGSCFFKRV